MEVPNLFVQTRVALTFEKTITLKFGGMVSERLKQSKSEYQVSFSFYKKCYAIAVFLIGYYQLWKNHWSDPAVPSTFPHNKYDHCMLTNVGISNAQTISGYQLGDLNSFPGWFVLCGTRRVLLRNFVFVFAFAFVFFLWGSWKKLMLISNWRRDER